MYSPELMAAFRTHAANVGPTTKPPYEVLHHWHPHIQVPQGHLPIRIAQIDRGQCSSGGHKLYHWAIFVPTSSRRGVGNFYELGGSHQAGYFVRHVVHNRYPQWDQSERGTHLVGWVAPSHLQRLQIHFSLVQIQQGRPDWNGQAWVVDALKGLNDPHMYAVQMDHGSWTRQMAILEGAWNAGDA